MADTSIWVGVVTGAAAIGGAGVNGLIGMANERRKIAHDLRVKQADRQRAIEDRRRTFEIENLQAAYDGLWQLTRDSAKAHLVDLNTARTTEFGYGGPVASRKTSEEHLAARSAAKKVMFLILDDEVRRLANEAVAALSEVSMLGVTAEIMDQGPVTADVGQRAHMRAAKLAVTAMEAIADRLRTVIDEE